MKRGRKLDSGGPFLHPADRALDRFKPGERNPDDFVWCDMDRKLDSAALGRKIQEVDPPTMLAGTAEIDVGAEWHPLLPPRITIVQWMPPALRAASNLTWIKADAKRLIDLRANPD